MKHTIVFHTIDTARKIQKLIDFKDQPISLSYSEASALLIIDSTTELSQKKLSLMLNLEPASIVTLIDQLEKSKLVRRQATNSDRRKYHIVLTLKGKTKVAQIEKKSLLLDNFLSSKLKETPARNLHITLSHINSYLNEWKTSDSEKYPMEGGEK